MLPGIAPDAEAQADQFYKGKTIRIMVGSTAGDFEDFEPSCEPKNGL
jgi:alkylhydroperoxidase/carboxymuconolactone decarboxylase family protein YurZ